MNRSNFNESKDSHVSYYKTESKYTINKVQNPHWLTDQQQSSFKQTSNSQNIKSQVKEVIKEVPVYYEKIVDRPLVIEKRVEVPVERPVYIDKIVEITKEVPIHVETIVEKEVEKRVYIERPDTESRFKLEESNKKNYQLQKEIDQIKHSTNVSKSLASDLNQERQRIEFIQRDLNTKSSIINSQNNQIRELQSELSRCKEMLSETPKVSTTNINTTHRTYPEYHTTHITRVNLEREDELKKELNDKTAECNQLKSELTKQQSENSETKKNIILIDKSRNSLLSEIELIKKSLRDLESEKSKNFILESEYRKKQQYLENLVSSLEIENQSLRNPVRDLSQSLEVSSSRIKLDSESQLNTLRAENNKLQNESRAYERSLREEREKTNQVNVTRELKERELEDRENKNKILEAKVKSLESELKRSRNKNELELLVQSERETKTKTQDEEIQRLKNNLDQKNEELSSISKQNDQLHQELNSLQFEVSRQREKNQVLLKENVTKVKVSQEGLRKPRDSNETNDDEDNDNGKDSNSLGILMRNNYIALERQLRDLSDKLSQSKKKNKSLKIREMLLNLRIVSHCSEIERIKFKESKKNK